MYNVVGGGDSALYGVEGPTFYLRNGFNNFQFLLPLALLAPAALALLGGPSSKLWTAQQKAGGNKQGSSHRTLMLVALSPLFTWLVAISALPHKEERFLFVVYPLVGKRFTCVALVNVDTAGLGC